MRQHGLKEGYNRTLQFFFFQICFIQRVSLFSNGRHEANFMETIVGEISAKLLDFMHLEVAEYPVGLESRVEDMLNLLRVGENDVHMVGI